MDRVLPGAKHHGRLRNALQDDAASFSGGFQVMWTQRRLLLCRSCRQLFAPRTVFLTGRYSSHRLNPSADLAPILRQRLISIREAVRRGERRGDLGGKIQEIGWYPFSGCGWRFWPDNHSGTVARGDDVLESAGNNPEGTNRGTRRDDAPVSGLVQQILVDQQNRGALARQELVPG